MFKYKKYIVTVCAFCGTKYFYSHEFKAVSESITISLRREIESSATTQTVTGESRRLHESEDLQVGSNKNLSKAFSGTSNQQRKSSHDGAEIDIKESGKIYRQSSKGVSNMSNGKDLGMVTGTRKTTMEEHHKEKRTTSAQSSSPSRVPTTVQSSSQAMTTSLNLSKDSSGHQKTSAKKSQGSSGKGQETNKSGVDDALIDIEESGKIDRQPSKGGSNMSDRKDLGVVSGTRKTTMEEHHKEKRTTSAQSSSPSRFPSTVQSGSQAMTTSLQMSKDASGHQKASGTESHDYSRKLEERRGMTKENVSGSSNVDILGSGKIDRQSSEARSKMSGRSDLGMVSGTRKTTMEEQREIKRTSSAQSSSPSRVPTTGESGSQALTTSLNMSKDSSGHQKISAKKSQESSGKVQKTKKSSHDGAQIDIEESGKIDRQSSRAGSNMSDRRDLGMLASGNQEKQSLKASSSMSNRKDLDMVSGTRKTTMEEHHKVKRTTSAQSSSPSRVPTTGESGSQAMTTSLLISKDSSGHQKASSTKMQGYSKESRERRGMRKETASGSSNVDILGSGNQETQSLKASSNMSDRKDFDMVGGTRKTTTEEHHKVKRTTSAQSSSPSRVPTTGESGSQSMTTSLNISKDSSRHQKSGATEMQGYSRELQERRETNTKSPRSPGGKRKTKYRYTTTTTTLTAERQRQEEARRQEAASEAAEEKRRRLKKDRLKKEAEEAAAASSLQASKTSGIGAGTVSGSVSMNMATSKSSQNGPKPSYEEYQKKKRKDY